MSDKIKLETVAVKLNTPSDRVIVGGLDRNLVKYTANGTTGWCVRLKFKSRVFLATCRHIIGDDVRVIEFEGDEYLRQPTGNEKTEDIDYELSLFDGRVGWIVEGTAWEDKLEDDLMYLCGNSKMVEGVDSDGVSFGYDEPMTIIVQVDGHDERRFIEVICKGPNRMIECNSELEEGWSGSVIIQSNGTGIHGKAYVVGILTCKVTDKSGKTIGAGGFFFNRKGVAENLRMDDVPVGATVTQLGKHYSEVMSKCLRSIGNKKDDGIDEFVMKLTENPAEVEKFFNELVGSGGDKSVSWFGICPGNWGANHCTVENPIDSNVRAREAAIHFHKISGFSSKRSAVGTELKVIGTTPNGFDKASGMVDLLKEMRKRAKMSDMAGKKEMSKNKDEQSKLMTEFISMASDGNWCPGLLPVKGLTKAGRRVIHDVILSYLACGNKFPDSVLDECVENAGFDLRSMIDEAMRSSGASGTGKGLKSQSANICRTMVLGLLLWGECGKNLDRAVLSRTMRVYCALFTSDRSLASKNLELSIRGVTAGKNLLAKVGVANKPDQDGGKYMSVMAITFKRLKTMLSMVGMKVWSETDVLRHGDAAGWIIDLFNAERADEDLSSKIEETSSACSLFHRHLLGDDLKVYTGEMTGNALNVTLNFGKRAITGSEPSTELMKKIIESGMSLNDPYPKKIDDIEGGAKVLEFEDGEEIMGREGEIVAIRELGGTRIYKKKIKGGWSVLMI